MLHQIERVCFKESQDLVLLLHDLLGSQLAEARVVGAVNLLHVADAAAVYVAVAVRKAAGFELVLRTCLLFLIISYTSLRHVILFIELSYGDTVVSFFRRDLKQRL